MTSSEAPTASGYFAAVCALCKTPGQKKIVLKEAGRHLLRCESCGVVFLDPQPSLNALTEEFVDHYIDSEAKLQGGFTTKRDPVLRAMSQRIVKSSVPGKILDVGCAGGYFLDQFFGQEWAKFGAEPSRLASQAAEKKGIRTWQGMFASLELPANYFDAVTLLDVIYYFPEPERELRLIRKIIKNDGALWIEVPLAEVEVWRNTSGFVKAVSGSFRPLFTSNHLFYFNLQSLQYVLEQAGFEVQGAYPLPPIAHPNFYADALYRSFYLSSKLLWTLSAGRTHFGPNLLVKAVPT